MKIGRILSKSLNIEIQSKSDSIALQISTLFLNYLKVADRTKLKNGRFINKNTVTGLEIPVFIEKKFNVRCCIRRHQIYQTQRNSEIGARLTNASETRHGALVENIYAISVVNNGKTFGHVPKFLTKLVANYILQ